MRAIYTKIASSCRGGASVQFTRAVVVTILALSVGSCGNFFVGNNTGNNASTNGPSQDKISIRYHSGGADSGTAPTDGNLYNVGEQATILGNTNKLEKKGFYVAAWNTADDGSGISYNFGFTVQASTSLDLYPDWKPFPIETRDFVGGTDGFLEFSTNDGEKLSAGYWRWYATTQRDVSEITAIIKKVSGAKNHGFGLIFAKNDTDNYYLAVINTEGMLSVSKTVGGVSSVIHEWAPCSFLVAGNNMENRIQIAFSSSNNMYSLLVNDHYFIGFAPDESIGTKGQCGFYTSVGSSVEEAFPDIPSATKFKMVYPEFLP